MRVRPLAEITSAFVIVTLAPSAARAQLSAGGGLDVGSGLARHGSGAWLRESQFAPMLFAAGRSGYLHFDGILSEQVGTLKLRRSNLDAAASTRPFGPFRLSLSTRYLQDPSELPVNAANISLTSALSARLGTGGVWLGAMHERRLASDTSLHPLQLAGGVWRALGSAIVSVTSQRHQMRVSVGPTLRELIRVDSQYNDTSGWRFFPDSSFVPDSSRMTRLRHWSDVEARLDWSAKRVTLSATMTARTRIDSLNHAIRWGALTAALQVTDKLALVAGGGTRPAPVGVGGITRFATIGVRMSPAALLRPPLPAAVRPSPTATRVELDASGLYRISVRVPNARTVELSGDFNRWAPVALERRSPNVWEALIALAPGTHRVSVRVDGDRWTAPPGLPAVEDEFNGRVGIIVVAR